MKRKLADEFNLDLDTLQEKLHSQAGNIRYLQDKLKDCKVTSQSAPSLANQNQQYPQKNNIKFMNWTEKPKENLRSELCRI